MNLLFFVGVIDAENAIVEIKCFPSLVRSNMNTRTAARENNYFPEIVINDQFQLNKKHAYYYQVYNCFQRLQCFIVIFALYVCRCIYYYYFVVF